MNINSKISSIDKLKKIKASLFNFLTTFLLSIILYSLLILLINQFSSNYKTNKQIINDVEIKYNLNLKENNDYSKFEEAIRKYYFHFGDNIINDYKKENKTFTIYYIYNVTVLKLPLDPVKTNYQTELFEYQKDKDGNFLVNEFGKLKEGSGRRYEKNLHDLFYTSYKHLTYLTLKYDKEYSQAFNYNNNLKRILRAISFLFIIIPYFFIYPLFNKHYETFFEKRYDVALIKEKNCYKINLFIFLLKNLAYFSLPFIGIFFLNLYTVTIFFIFPLFINFLTLLISSSSQSLNDKIFKISYCENSNSLIFRNKKHEEEFLNKDDENLIYKYLELKNILTSKNENNVNTFIKENNLKKYYE